MYVHLVIGGHDLKQNRDHFRPSLPTEATRRCPTQLSILIGPQNREESGNGLRTTTLSNAVAYETTDALMWVAEQRKN